MQFLLHEKIGHNLEQKSQMSNPGQIQNKVTFRTGFSNNRLRLFWKIENWGHLMWSRQRQKYVVHLRRKRFTTLLEWAIPKRKFSNVPRRCESISVHEWTCIDSASHWEMTQQSQIDTGKQPKLLFITASQIAIWRITEWLFSRQSSITQWRIKRASEQRGGGAMEPPSSAESMCFKFWRRKWR